MSDFEFSFSRPSSSHALRRNKNTFRVLVLGDFCGDQESVQPLPQRSPSRIDIDTFDGVMKKLAPVATVATGHTSERYKIEALSDFGPDALYERLAAFETLREQRAAIRDGKGLESSKELADKKPTNNPPVETTGDTLERLLEQKASTSSGQSATGLLDQFFKRVGGSDDTAVATDIDAQLAGCDSAIAEQLRSLLRQSTLKTLEANWRGLYDLVNVIEDDEIIDVALLHATRDELKGDLLHTDTTQDSHLIRMLVDDASGSFGGEPWDLIVSCDPYGVDDAYLIGALGALSEAAGGKLLTNVPIAHINKEPDATWSRLRSAECAKDIHVVTPMALARPPYGDHFESPERLTFEQCPVAPDPADLLWGSSAMVVAACMVQAHQEGTRGNLSNQSAAQCRPQFTFLQDDVKVMQPVAETLLSDAHAEQLRSDWGVMPIRAERNGNRLLFVALQPLNTN